MDCAATRVNRRFKAASPKTPGGPLHRPTEKRAVYLDREVQQRSMRAAKASAEDAHNGFAAGAPVAAKASAALSQAGVASVSSMQNFQGSRVTHEKGQKVSTMGDEVIATDDATGRERWRHKLGGDLTKEGGALVHQRSAHRTEVVDIAWSQVTGG